MEYLSYDRLDPDLAIMKKASMNKIRRHESFYPLFRPKGRLLFSFSTKFYEISKNYKKGRCKRAADSKKVGANIPKGIVYSGFLL